MAEKLTLATLAAQPELYHLIDVRDAIDYAAGHVEGAVHIPLADLEARSNEIPEGRIPVAICNWGGGRSAEGAAELHRLGYEGALTLEGGTQAWLAAVQQPSQDVTKSEESRRQKPASVIPTGS